MEVEFAEKFLSDDEDLQVLLQNKGFSIVALSVPVCPRQKKIPK